MTVVLDAYALTALLAAEPAAEEVADLITAGPVAVTAPNLAEAADRLGRVYGLAVARTHAAVESLEQSSDLTVRGIDRMHAWRAAELRVEHYHRTRCPLSLSDCLLLAATGDEERLATSDPHVLATADLENIARIALADSQGRRYGSEQA